MLLLTVYAFFSLHSILFQSLWKCKTEIHFGGLLFVKTKLFRQNMGNDNETRTLCRRNELRGGNWRPVEINVNAGAMALKLNANNYYQNRILRGSTWKEKSPTWTVNIKNLKIMQFFQQKAGCPSILWCFILPKAP